MLFFAICDNLLKSLLLIVAIAIKADFLKARMGWLKWAASFIFALFAWLNLLSNAGNSSPSFVIDL